MSGVAGAGSQRDAGAVTDPTDATPALTQGAADRALARSAASRRAGGRGSSDWRKRLEIAVLVAPALALFLVFVVWPIVQAARYSLFRWNGLEPMTNFIGLDNYKEVLGDTVFRSALGHNFIIVALSLLIQLPLGLGIALLLNRKMRGRTVLRLIIFVPYVIAEVIAAVVWLLLLQPRGPLDAMLEAFHLTGIRQLWLAEPKIVLYTMFGVLTWKYLGFAIILFLAGLQSVPIELSEAAALDGASWWQTQRRITIPLLGPTIRIWAFLSMIGSLQLFDMVWVMTHGGPGRSTETMVTYMISTGFDRNRLGYGTAVAIVLFAISLAMALLYQRFILRRDNIEADSGRKR